LLAGLVMRGRGGLVGKRRLFGEWAAEVVCGRTGKSSANLNPLGG